tara:strand:- start:135 stop:332 length:198 start_codon:yes stop_codon:yes gene_type:complete
MSPIVMFWVLVWVQLISGKPMDHFQLGVYETQSACAKARERAKVMITHDGTDIICLYIEIEDDKK